MELVAPNEFIARISLGWEPRMKTGIYDRLEFQCACGRLHLFSTADTPPLLELPGMRLVVKCPESQHHTCFKVRGLFRYRMESQFGALMPDPEDSLSIGQSLPATAGRGIPSTSGFTPVFDDDVRNAHNGLPHRIASGPFTGPDGRTYWVSIVLGLAQDAPGAPMRVAPKLSFVRLDRTACSDAHAAVTEVIAKDDPDSWPGRFPPLFPETGFEDSVRDMLGELGSRLRQ